jgi:hypothetical protein
MITLDMPAEIRNYVLEFQGKKKAASGLGHYSQQQAIIAIIREHKDFSETQNKMKTETHEKEHKEGG